MATSPDPARTAPRKRSLRDTDILDAFRVVTGWSNQQVLHFESCDECDPFGSVVCAAFPPPGVQY